MYRVNVSTNYTSKLVVCWQLFSPKVVIQASFDKHLFMQSFWEQLSLCKVVQDYDGNLLALQTLEQAMISLHRMADERFLRD